MNTEVLNLQLKKLKNYCIYSALLCFFWIPFGTAAEDIPPPPEQGEKTKSTSNKAVAPPPLPKEQKRSDNTKPRSVVESRPVDAPKEQGPESDDSRNIPEPEVNIIHRKDTTIEEYRVNGRIRYVKIIPRKGKPYYLVDKDGDGELETRHSDLDGIPPINEWILLEW